LKFEVKNNQLQLPVLYSENQYKKINNNRSLETIKRTNNTITPNKIIYNSSNLTNSVQTKKEPHNRIDTSIKSLRRFNYPSSTQILQSRVFYSMNIFVFF
jgi:TFIIF-interacting CTD phosphatase-like protein